jgi:hypothetical protein
MGLEACDCATPQTYHLFGRSLSIQGDEVFEVLFQSFDRMLWAKSEGAGGKELEGRSAAAEVFGVPA